MARKGVTVRVSVGRPRTYGSIQAQAGGIPRNFVPPASNRCLLLFPKREANICASVFYTIFVLSSVMILMWLAANQGVNAYNRGYDAAIPDATGDYQSPGVKPHFGVQITNNTSFVSAGMLLAFFLSLFFKGISAMFIIKCADNWENRCIKICWQILGGLLPVADLLTIKMTELFANHATYKTGYDNSYLFTYFKLCNNHTLSNCHTYPMPLFANSTEDFTGIAPLTEIDLSQTLPTSASWALAAGLSLGAGIAAVFCCAKGGLKGSRSEASDDATRSLLPRHSHKPSVNGAEFV